MGIEMKMRHKLELNAPLMTVRIPGELQEGDAEANAFVLELYRDHEPFEPDGETVTGYLTRADGNSVLLNGTVDKNIITVTLSQACYRVPGFFSAFIRLTNTDGKKRTIFKATGMMSEDKQGGIVDDEHVVPTLDDIIAQMEAVERATETANAAAETANAAAESAAEAARGIDEKVEAANAELTGRVGKLSEEIDDEKNRAVARENEIEELFTAPTQEAVDNWLNEHPEATTTVVDGSLTEEKFANNLKDRAIKDYVTPQMFGAKGDGVTDDTAALQSAIDSGIAVKIPEGAYLVTRKIVTYPNTNISGFGNKSNIICHSIVDLFMVAYATKISNLKIVLDSPDVAMDGAIFKMNEESLANSEPVHAANVRSFISDITIEVTGDAVTSGHLACFETSLKSNWGLSGKRAGFYGFNVNNVIATCAVTAKVGYFYRSYVADGNWITSVQFSNCGMIGQRWCFFMGYTDDDLFNDTYRGECNLTAYNVYHQKMDTNCEGFLFQRTGTRVNLIGCEPWDWTVTGPESTRYPYVIDKALVTALESNWLYNPRGSVQQYKLVEKVGNEYVYTPLTESDYTTYYNFLKTDFNPAFFKRAQCLSDGSRKIALIASVNMPKGSNFRTITFEHQYKTQIIQCCVWLHADGTVSINVDDDLNYRFSFYYTIIDGVFSLYHVSTTVFDAKVSVVKTDCFTNSTAHFSGKGAPFSDYCMTINALDGTQELYLDELPAGAALLPVVATSKTQVITSPNGTRFKLTVDNAGNLSATPY